MTSSPTLLWDERRGNEEEEVPFLYIGLLLKGPDKGQEWDSDAHVASEALRGPERFHSDLFSPRVEVPLPASRFGTATHLPSCPGSSGPKNYSLDFITLGQPCSQLGSVRATPVPLPT